jgi:hypothetical protein
MSCLPASYRGLHETVRKTVRAAIAGAVVAGLLAGELCGWNGHASAHAAERTVLAVVTCDSYADLKKQFGWLGAQVGQPGLAGMLESVLLMATQGRGLAGLDVRRPLGAVVTTDGDDIAVHGFVPVKSLDKLLESLQAVTGPTEQSGDARSLTLPSGIALDMVEKDGWAIVSPQGFDVEAVDPAPLFAPLSENYTLGIELFPHLLPEPLRMQLRMLIEQGAATAGEQGQQLDGRALAAVLDSLADTESLAFGIAIDTEKDRMFIENRTVAVPGSPAAMAMEGSDKGQSSVPLPPAADGKRPAVSAHLVQPVPEASRQEVLALLDQALPPDSNDPLTKTLSLLFRETIASVLATGGIDAALCVDTTAAAKPTALPAITAGMRVKDGAALENRVKKSFGGQNGGTRLLPPGVTVAFDSGKVDATNLHTITVDLSGTDAAESLGRSLDLTLAVTPDYAFLMAGGDPRQRVAAVLGADAKADPQSKPIAGIDVSLQRVLAFAADRGALPAEAVPGSQDDGGDQSDGNVRLLVRPIERGVATRLSVDGSAVKAVAAGAGAANAGGQAIPPGLPIPNGFPIPAPAR